MRYASMSTFNYVTYLVNPLEPKDLILAVRSKSESKFIEMSGLKDLEEPIVTHDIWYLVESLRDAGVEIPNRFIDINLVQRFLAGRPAAEAQMKHGVLWDTYNILSKSHANEKNLKVLRRQFWSHDPVLSEEDTTLIFFEFLEALEMYFESTLKELSPEEKGALFDIEIPVHNVFLRCQSEGIFLDEELLEKNLEDIDKAYYRILSRLKDLHEFKGGPFDTAYIYEYMQKKGISVDKPYSGASIDQIIKYAKDVDERIELLHELRQLRSSKSALLKLSFSEKSMANIIFDTFGTVTGRIMAKEPHVQFVKKEYRGVFVPRDDYECIYLDYSNYEPCILAFLSQDTKLIEAVNSGDFYKFIASELLDDRCSRDVAKILFIQYSYGASIVTLSNYLSIKSGLEHDIAISLAKKIVNYFTEVNDWKEKVVAEALEASQVVTSDFIVRKFSSKQLLKEKSHRQIVNHHVQSTGSVHIKWLILRLQDRYPEVGILIPMFDALYIQVPKNEVDYNVSIRDLFISSFQESFPGVNVDVTISNFS